MDKPIIVFDGVCNLCNAFVNIIIEKDAARRFLFTAAQSQAGRTLLGEPDGAGAVPETVILLEGTARYVKSTAVLRIAKLLKLPYSLLYAFIIVPAPLRDRIYNWVALNRSRWFGTRNNCRTPSPGEMDRFLT